MLAVGAVALGWVWGFVRPVAVEIAFGLALLIVAALRVPLLALLEPRINLPAPLILGLATLGLAFLINIPGSRLAAGIRDTRLGLLDSVLGTMLQLGILFIVVYMAMVSLADTERAVRPLLTNPITVRAIDTFATEVRHDAFLNALVRPEQLRADREAAATGHLTLSLLETQHPWVGLYMGALRPSLLHSGLAPVVLRYGDGLPLVGRRGTMIP
jgi:Colicin V production protein